MIMAAKKVKYEMNYFKQKSCCFENNIAFSHQFYSFLGYVILAHLLYVIVICLMCLHYTELHDLRVKVSICSSINGLELNPINFSLYFTKYLFCIFYKKLWLAVVPQFRNTFFFEKFSAQTEAFGKILFLLENSASLSYEHKWMLESFPKLWDKLRQWIKVPVYFFSQLLMNKIIH